MTLKIWIVTEIYFPEEASTGHLLTQLAETLAKTDDVSVLCGQPSYRKRGIKAPKQETHHNVFIQRCWTTTFDKNFIPLRIANISTICASFFWMMLFRFKRGDRVLVVTNPPLLPYVTVAACALKRSKCTILIHDVYPDVLVPTGITREGSLLYRVINRSSKFLYRHVSHIVVIGRDMRQRMLLKTSRLLPKTHVIPNWGDSHIITPKPKDESLLLTRLDLTDKLVVQYSGNLGRTHDIATIVQSAKTLKQRGNAQIHFLFIGWGAASEYLTQEITEHGLDNITFIPPVERSDLIDSLAACDIAIISFKSDMWGISVPSRMYNIMASGRPIIAISEPLAEIAQVVKENDIGWVLDPGDHVTLTDTLEDIVLNPASCTIKGARARKTVKERYTLEQSATKYRNILAAP